ncbi:hypothetical protein HK19_01080 [Acetobacter persici]|uniref:hypothetical protein n=1 Tax=Acetobacter persici TaxID=1076596 RepID=UPI000A3C9B9D|nr:hypothetical protein [Acetobacter persici]OUI92550.1 hypothetical protein HK19_01080 [Acetobacter persici]
MSEAQRIAVRSAKSRYREKIRKTPELAETTRLYQREWRRAWREILRADPDAHAAFLEHNRERYRAYQREWKRQWRANLSDEEKRELSMKMREWRRQQALMELISADHAMREILNEK